MKCQSCGKEIKELFFCGDSYYGDYKPGTPLFLCFECPHCYAAVNFINIKVPAIKRVAKEKLEAAKRESGKY